MANPQGILGKLIQAAVNKAVSEKLGTLFNELCSFAKDMDKVEALSARLMLLDMVSDATGEFITKMRTRIT